MGFWDGALVPWTSATLSLILLVKEAGTQTLASEAAALLWKPRMAHGSWVHLVKHQKKKHLGFCVI